MSIVPHTCRAIKYLTESLLDQFNLYIVTVMGKLKKQMD